MDNKVFGVCLRAAELAILGGGSVNRREFCLSAYEGHCPLGGTPFYRSLWDRDGGLRLRTIHSAISKFGTQHSQETVM